MGTAHQAIGFGISGTLVGGAHPTRLEQLPGRSSHRLGVSLGFTTEPSKGATGPVGLWVINANALGECTVLRNFVAGLGRL